MASLTPTSQSSSARRFLYWAIAAALTVVLLHWSFRDVHWQAVGQLLARARWGWLAFGLVAYIFSYILRAWRWGLVLAADCDPGPLHQRIAAIFVGYAGNSFLPLSAGEVVRAGLVNRFANVPFKVALGSILAERLLDVMVVFLLLLVACAQHAVVLPLGMMGAVVAVAGLGFWIAARFPEAIAHGLGQAFAIVGLVRLGKTVKSMVFGILKGLSALQQPRRFLAVLAVSLLIWLANGLLYWSVLLALDIRGIAGQAPGIWGALLTQSLAAFAIVLPSSPGYIGPFEAAVRVALDLFQVSGDGIVAYALVLRLLMYVLTPLVGVAIALKLGLSKAEVRGQVVHR